MNMKFTFKGEAKPDGPRWQEGWQDGHDNIIHNKECPYGYWGSVGNGYGEGYAEGRLYAISEMMGKLCINHWPPKRDFELN